MKLFHIPMVNRKTCWWLDNRASQWGARSMEMPCPYPTEIKLDFVKSVEHDLNIIMHANLIIFHLDFICRYLSTSIHGLFLLYLRGSLALAISKSLL